MNDYTSTDPIRYYSAPVVYVSSKTIDASNSSPVTASDNNGTHGRSQKTSVIVITCEMTEDQWERYIKSKIKKYKPKPTCEFHERLHARKVWTRNRSFIRNNI